MRYRNELDHLLTEREVTLLLRISRVTLWRHVKKSMLPAPIKLGYGTRWRQSEILPLVDKGTHYSRGAV